MKECCKCCQIGLVVYTVKKWLWKYIRIDGQKNIHFRKANFLFQENLKQIFSPKTQNPFYEYFFFRPTIRKKLKTNEERLLV